MHRDDPAHQIDGQSAAAEDWRLALLLQAVALGGADAGQEFVDAERFGHEIVGAEVQGVDFRGFVVAAGQDDDGDSGAGGADAADDLGAVDVRQAETAPQGPVMGHQAVDLGFQRFMVGQGIAWEAKRPVSSEL